MPKTASSPSPYNGSITVGRHRRSLDPDLTAAPVTTSDRGVTRTVTLGVLGAIIAAAVGTAAPAMADPGGQGGFPGYRPGTRRVHRTWRRAGRVHHSCTRSDSGTCSVAAGLGHPDAARRVRPDRPGRSRPRVRPGVLRTDGTCVLQPAEHLLHDLQR